TSLCSFLSTTPRLPRSPPFPYTTLFRSSVRSSSASSATAARRSARSSVTSSPPCPDNGRSLTEPPPVTRQHASIHDLASACQARSEEHTSELQSQSNLVCRLLLEKKKTR